jgi:type II secretory pathway predicted ATPase ExeA
VKVGLLGMFDQFYNIPEKPFSESPDPRFLCLTSSHSETLRCLQENAESGHGLQAVIAAAGFGKTTLMYAILDRLRDYVDTAFVPDASWGATSLLGFLLTDLGVHDPGPSLTSRRETLDRFLASRRNAKPIVFVLDEAHTLDRGSLEELDLLLARSPLSFQVILAGRTPLTTVLNTVAPRSLLDRLAATCRLGPLSRDDTAMYVRHRLQVAGYPRRELFTAKALEMIADESFGAPRNINVICARALKHGSTNRKKQIDESVIREVLAHCSFKNAEAPAPSLPVMNKPEILPEARSIPSPSPAVPQTTARQPMPKDRTYLADVLRSWLVAHSGIWSGTVGELYEHLQRTYASQLQDLTISSQEELSQRLQLSTAELKGAGVDPEVRKPPGQPRLLVLRLVQASIAA